MDFNTCPFYRERIVNNFTHLQSLPLDEFAEWLDKYCQFDNSPWITWFDETYCSKCESVEIPADEAKSKLDLNSFYGRPIKCAYCEVHKNCKYFPDMEESPSNIDIIKLWLKQERKHEDVK